MADNEDDNEITTTAVAPSFFKLRYAWQHWGLRAFRPKLRCGDVCAVDVFGVAETNTERNDGDLAIIGHVLWEVT